MNSLPFYSNLISRIYVHTDCVSDPAVERARALLSGTPVFTVESHSEIPEEHLRGDTLYVTAHTNELLRRCPGSHRHICCSYLTIDLYSGCLLACTYCIMRHYLNFAPITVYTDTGRSIDTIREIARANSENTVRVGTGEVGDSLLFDPLFLLSERFITAFSDLPNVFFEMKTKTHFVDHLLDVPNKGNSVVGFSLNPSHVQNREEGISSPIEQRLLAAHKAVKSGYRLSFHFDPIFVSDNWEDHYLPLVSRIAEYPSERIAWISMGTFRYPTGLKDKIGDRPYLLDEFAPSLDGKMRNLQRIRIRIYCTMLEALKKVTDAPVYLCMESAAVWRRVYGSLPGAIPQLKPIFGGIRYQETKKKQRP